MSRSFEDRHIGPTSVDEAAMLKALGYSDLSSFIGDVVPSNIAIKGVIEKALDSGKSEVEVIAELRSIASENKVFRSLIGTGYYGTIVPPVVKRAVKQVAAYLYANRGDCCDMRKALAAAGGLLDAYAVVRT